MTIDPWPRDRASDLVALCDAAMPAEGLVADELVACCYDDEGVVLGTRAGDGAVSLCIRRAGDDVVGFVKLLAVVPAARRQGCGRALLDAGADWARASRVPRRWRWAARRPSTCGLESTPR